MEKDYYEILGLTDEDKKLPLDEFNKKIKTIFRKLSVQWHPDKFAKKSEEERQDAENKFKEITEAYSTLSDAKKREEYDMKQQFGGMNMNGFNEDMFNDFMNPFGRHRKQVVKGTDITVTVNLTIDECFFGCTKEVSFVKLVECETCQGTGATKTKKCPHCNGMGRIRQEQHRMGMTLIQETICPHCGGIGVIVEEKCPKCNGNGGINESEKINVVIPPGVFNGAVICKNGLGNSPIGVNFDNVEKINGDLNIIIKEIPNAEYRHVNNNIEYDLNLDLSEVMLGCTKNVKCLDGEVKKIVIPPLVNYGKTYRITGKGFADPRSPFNKSGDMHIIVKYKMPSSLTEKQKELIKEFYKIENEKH